MQKAFSISEARKDPEGYRKAENEYEGAEEALEKAGGEGKRIVRELAEAVERFNKAHSAREHKFEQYTHNAQEERDGWVSYTRTYRHANMSARKDKTLPESFKIDPETLIKIPDVFEILNWECPDDREGEGR